MNKTKMVFDMETSDPDDFLTLLLLLGHPRVDLQAVTVTPGSQDQIGVVRTALEWFGRHIPVGSFDITRPNNHVSMWHRNVYGSMPLSGDAEKASSVLGRWCGEDVILVTGGPLKNVGAAIRAYGLGFKTQMIVCQGGFAGEGVVPTERQLDKFKRLKTCPTFNLNGDPKSAFLVLEHNNFGLRRFVSKNVCHGVYYDSEVHEMVRAIKDKSLSMSLIWKGMGYYLSKNKEGKKFHDPLAACCAIDPSIGEWAEVEIYRDRNGHWGSRLSPGTGTWIITGYDRTKFLKTLMETV
jgi:inosine-uridine nucleoside N-ribohydrolase